MTPSSQVASVLGALTPAFLALTACFYANLWGRPIPLAPATPVESRFTNTAPVRVPGAEMARLGEDTSNFQCYACHDQKKTLLLKFDADQNLVVSPDHQDIVLNHGRHHRNNNCFNCHNEKNLELLQIRDGREIPLMESTPLCGSCHGPTYRDWDAGVHGRTSGSWDPRSPARQRQPCVACHNPHNPHFEPQKAAPGPHSLRSPSPATTTPRPEH